MFGLGGKLTNKNTCNISNLFKKKYLYCFFQLLKYDLFYNTADDIKGGKKTVITKIVNSFCIGMVYAGSL